MTFGLNLLRQLPVPKQSQSNPMLNFYTDRIRIYIRKRAGQPFNILVLRQDTYNLLMAVLSNNLSGE